MALEHAYEDPRTLKRLCERPLGAVLDGFCGWMIDQGYCRHTVRAHLSRISHLNRYLRLDGVAEHEKLCTKHICTFLKDYPHWCRHRGSKAEHLDRMRFSLHRFSQYLQEAGLIDEVQDRAVYQPMLDEYLQWMGDYKHSAPGTVEVRCRSLIQFLKWLGAGATTQGISNLSAERIESFLLSYTKDKGRSARRSMQSALRTFLRFCLHRGYLQLPLDRAVPTLRSYKLARLPRGLSEAEAQKVLGTINRQTDAGRRDYAVIELLYTYGVRGGQVRALRLGDISWGQNQILFRASKGGKDSLLPLTDSVGESILDYLRKSRPPCSYPEVFLTCRAPYHPLADSTCLSEIIRRHIQAAGIQVPTRGAHAFRHGFATRMLQQGHSLKAIADVLGHRYIQTTFIYTKVDFDALKQVGLEWPEEVEQ